jgi:sulfite reductase beta subunit-like hemoprotein
MAVDTEQSVQNQAANGQQANGQAAAPQLSKREIALKFTEDGRPATLAAIGDDRAELNRNERIKVTEGGFGVWQRIVDIYSKQGYESIPDEDFERFKWYGLYRQRPNNGHFMMRFKVPGGALNAEQVRVCASLTRDFARGIIDITTRQDFQVHWLTIADVPTIVERLATVGMTTMGACGDVSRNVTGSPLAGIDPAEIIDPLPLVNAATALFAGNVEYADLPRKHKITVVGHRSTGMPEINEIGLYAVRRRDDGSVGYGCMVGGGLSTEPHIAQDLGVFITPEQGLDVLEAITRLYRDFGYRRNRKHARLKYLVADWGAAKVRAQTEEFLGYKLRDAEPDQEESPSYGDRLGVHPQKQPGLNWIGVPVIAGRITADQLEAIGDIAAEFGSGDVRLTIMQSFYIINVPDDKVAGAVERLQAIGLPINLSPIKTGVIACTGTEFCNLALTETKDRAKNLVNLLDQNVKWRESDFFRINVNGCPNSCGQHWIADVGLQGCTKKVNGQMVEHYDIFLGGTLGSKAVFNRRIKRLPVEEVVPAVQRLIEHFQAHRQGEESFTEFCNRHTEEELETIF